MKKFKIDYSKTSLIFLRKILRKIGLTPILARYLYGTSYEEKVNKAIKNTVMLGDTIWDIGANIGVYTLIFSELTGKKGKVYSFEPHPKTFDKLKTLSTKNNIQILNLGLSNEKKQMLFTNKTKNELNSIVDESYIGETITTNIETADNIIKTKFASIPNYIKIDVEGYELFVLRGMNLLLKNSILRNLMIEVHHSIMDDLNLPDGPKQIIKILKDNNFKVEWIDPSHILATRL